MGSFPGAKTTSTTIPTALLYSSQTGSKFLPMILTTVPLAMRHASGGGLAKCLLLAEADFVFAAVTQFVLKRATGFLLEDTLERHLKLWPFCGAFVAKRFMVTPCS